MSLAVSTAAGEREWRWLHTQRFDLVFIFGFLLLGMAMLALIVGQPALFHTILLLDLWLLGYHHVISTYTRLCFDRESFAASKVFIFGLFPLVAAATALVAWQIGVWAVFSVYFYWQWFHYTRQSWGVARAYRAKDKDALYEDGWLDQAIFWAVPILGIVNRSSQGQAKFLGQDLFVLPLPQWVMPVCAALTAGLVIYWAVRRAIAYQQNRLSKANTLYTITHMFVFAAAYIYIPEVTLGWLLINVWHNGQYILFVWMYNTRRFKGAVDPKAKFLSYISQPQMIWLYMAVCIALTGALYIGVLQTINNALAMGITGTIVLYQIVNFHHYVVDGFLWKVRKGPMKKTLDL